MTIELDFRLTPDFIIFEKSLFMGDVFHIDNGVFKKGSSETLENYAWCNSSIIKLPKDYFENIQKSWENGDFE